MLRALSLACLAGGAGFRPSTDSDSCSSPEALGEMGNVDFGFWALVRNLVSFNVSQSTSAQAGCSRVLGSSWLAAMPDAGWGKLSADEIRLAKLWYTKDKQINV